MPQIIVTADGSIDPGEGAVMLRERVSLEDFESDHFGAQLLERLGWAVGDAHELEQDRCTGESTERYEDRIHAEHHRREPDRLEV